MTFGLVFRAIVVPSTARRTLVLGLVASAFRSRPRPYGRCGRASPCRPSCRRSGRPCGAWAGSPSRRWPRGRSSDCASRCARPGSSASTRCSEKIGEGGMGAVYRASHAMLRRPTAVKLLPPGQAGSERLQRFEREVQLTSRLTHPNTISIFDYGRTPDGVFYYAMEYLEGLNLEDLARHDGPQPAGRVVHVLRQVAGSLAEAARGRAHPSRRQARERHPGRAARRCHGRCQGGGLRAGEGPGPRPRTSRARIASRARRCTWRPRPSPLRGAWARAATCTRWGAWAYYLLTGRPVFEGRNVVEVCGHHLHTRPTPPAGRLGQPVPEGLQNLLLACLEKEPSRRPSFAGEFLETLDALRERCRPGPTSRRADGGPRAVRRSRPGCEAAARGGQGPARAHKTREPARSRSCAALDIRRRA